MALVADRVKEATATTGTSNITMTGAITQYQSFYSAFGINKSFYYGILDGNGTDWETGQGTLSSSTVLIRSQVTASSNSGALLALSANTHTVFSSLVAELIADLPGNSYMQHRGLVTL